MKSQGDYSGMKRKSTKKLHVSSLDLASLYVALGDHRKALDLLDRAFQERSYGVLFLHLYPEFKPLRDEPRFQALVRAVGIHKC